MKWLQSQEDQRQLVIDCYYDAPLENAANRYAASDEWREIRKLLPAAGGHALDLGAGHGITSYALARAGWQVSAVEPDPSEIVGQGAIKRLAEASGLPIEVFGNFGEALPFPTESFDLVFCRQAMHHARDLKGFCREVARVLRRGGTFIAVRDHVISTPGQLVRFQERHPLHFLYGGENAFRLSEYRHAIAQAGMTVVRELGSFDSAINYAPNTRDSLREALVGAAARLAPADTVVKWFVRSEQRYELLLRLLSRLDRRPGRLYSFVSVRR